MIRLISNTIPSRGTPSRDAASKIEKAMLRPSLIAGIALALALPLAAQQQDNSSQQPSSSPPAPTSKSAPQKKDQKDPPKKNTPEENPFPRAESEAAAQKAQPPDSGSQPNAPQPQPGSPSKPGPSGENPFPEAQSEKAAHQAEQQDRSEPNSAPGSTEDQNFSSSQVKGLDMPTTDETPPTNLPPSPLPWNPKLARKDANIGDFYMETGDWKGAYDRFLEANRSDPGNAEAVFGLAESAQHIGHQDEALRMYRLYLSALPRGSHAKEVHKALKEMGAEH